MLLHEIFTVRLISPKAVCQLHTIPLCAKDSVDLHGRETSSGMEVQFFCPFLTFDKEAQ
jgi:hypothetical protein